MLFHFLLFLLASFPAFGSFVTGKGDVNVIGEYRDFPQTGFGDTTYAWESIVRANYQSKWDFKFFRLELTPELRGFESRTRTFAPTAVGYASVAGPRRFLDLSSTLYNQGSSQWLLDFERANFVSFWKDFELQLGRKPVGVGTLKVFPIWNKFSRPLPNTAGPNFIFGEDSGILRWQRGTYAFQVIDIEGRNANDLDAVHWAEGILYDPQLELHLMASHWWTMNTLGAALAKDLGGATLRAEGLWIGYDRHDAAREAQGGLGLEYAVSEVWTLLAEAVYFDRGASSTADYPLFLPSRFRPLRARSYTYLQAAAQLSPFWSLSLAGLMNLVDASVYPLLQLTRSLSDNWDLVLDARFPLGRANAEFSRTAFQFPAIPQGTSIGAPSQYSLQLNVSY